MARKKLLDKLAARQIIRILSALFVLGTLALLYQHKTYLTFLGAPMVIILVALTDGLHYRRSVRKKNPVKEQLAHFPNRFMRKSDTISTDDFEKKINLN